MQCACAIWSSVASPALEYFSTSLHERRDFREKKIIEHETLLRLSLQLFPETFLIIRRSKRDMIKNMN